MLTAPIAKVSVNFGMSMPSWYDIKSFVPKDFETKFEAVTGIDEIKSNSERIRKVMEEEIKALGGDATRLFLGGFSQGASLALHNGLSYETRLGGIMVYSGFLFPISQQGEENKKTPIFISHGKADPLIKFEMADKSYQALDVEAHGIVRISEDGLQHSVSNNILAKSKEWFAKSAEAK